jgi:UBX domain-containing protein 1
MNSPLRSGSLKRQQAAPTAGSSFFGGSGNTLGSEEVASQAIPDPTTKAAQEDDDEEATVTKVLTFWRNGFSIDDGELMDYQRDAEILQQLRDGCVRPVPP